MPNNNVLKKPITDKEAIKQLLPHRKPMLMVDGLVYFDGEKAVSNFTVAISNIFVDKTHFSEPGLVEHMAQSAALLTGYRHKIQNLPVKDGFIASIKNLKIERLPKVNDVIATEVKIAYGLPTMSIVHITSKTDEIDIASAEMTLVLRENE
ncbi:MAG: hypothetical protein R2797_01820 [Gelidibacter sp.]